MPSEPVVVCGHLVKVYDSASGRVQAVRGVDLEIDEGTATAIVGPSGSGKSSLLRMIAGLDRPTAGSALIAGTDLFSLRPGSRARLRGTLVTLVFQRPSDNLFSHLTARQQLARLGAGQMSSPRRWPISGWKPEQITPPIGSRGERSNDWRSPGRSSRATAW